MRGIATNVLVRYLLAFAYNVSGNYEGAVWILSSTGLPETVITNPRSGSDWEGFLSLVNATYGLGETDTAEGLAGWFYDKPDHHDNADWFVEALLSCTLVVLGRQDEALDTLDLIRRSPRLIPEYFLKDTPCFRQLADESRYQAIVSHFESRRAKLRERLPTTLQRFGVSL